MLTADDLHSATLGSADPWNRVVAGRTRGAAHVTPFSRSRWPGQRASRSRQPLWRAEPWRAHCTPAAASELVVARGVRLRGVHGRPRLLHAARDAPRRVARPPESGPRRSRRRRALVDALRRSRAGRARGPGAGPEPLSPPGGPARDPGPRGARHLRGRVLSPAASGDGRCGGEPPQREHRGRARRPTLPELLARSAGRVGARFLGPLPARNRVGGRGARGVGRRLRRGARAARRRRRLYLRRDPLHQGAARIHARQRAGASRHARADGRALQGGRRLGARRGHGARDAGEHAVPRARARGCPPASDGVAVFSARPSPGRPHEPAPKPPAVARRSARMLELPARGSANVIGRRPAGGRPERVAAALSARIVVARADFYPSVTITGSTGFQSSTFQSALNSPSAHDLFDSDSFAGFIGLGVNWPILNYGRIENNVRVADARFEEAVVAYRNTVLQAAADVEMGLSSFLKNRERSALLAQSVEAAQRTVELSLIQYRQGAADFLRVNQAQVDLVNRQNSLVVARAGIAQGAIDTYRALGGGWETHAGSEFVPRETVDEMRRRTDWGDLLDPYYGQQSDLLFPRPDDTERAPQDGKDGQP